MGSEMCIRDRQWTEQEFLKNTEGSAIRRIGYQAWVRNVATGLGNAQPYRKIINALNDKAKEQGLSEMALEHITWALGQHNSKAVT